MRRWVSALLAAAGLFAVLSSCSVSATDFQADAQDFLTGEDVFGAYGIDFTDPVCEQPASTDVGETFTCTAQGDDGLTYRFSLQITGKKSMSLESITPVYPDATTATAAAPVSTPPPSEPPPSS